MTETIIIRGAYVITDPRLGASGVIPAGAVVIVDGTIRDTGPFAAIVGSRSNITPQGKLEFLRRRAGIGGWCTGYGRFADRPFLCGESLTLADIPAATSLYRYFAIEIKRPSVPNVEAWYRRLQERPAYREHIMVPFGELYGRLDY